jgi:sRNA-binding carbon storage regulator CsrA
VNGERKKIHLPDKPMEGRGLVLTRKVGQEILIEHGLLRIQILQVKGKQVRIKFIGNVRVDRAEKVEAENDGPQS